MKIPLLLLLGLHLGGCAGGQSGSEVFDGCEETARREVSAEDRSAGFAFTPSQAAAALNGSAHVRDNDGESVGTIIIQSNLRAEDRTAHVEREQASRLDGSDCDPAYYLPLDARYTLRKDDVMLLDAAVAADAYITVEGELSNSVDVPAAQVQGRLAERLTGQVDEEAQETHHLSISIFGQASRGAYGMLTWAKRSENNTSTSGDLDVYTPQETHIGSFTLPPHSNLSGRNDGPGQEQIDL